MKKLLPTKRKLIQLYSALLFNANIKGFSSGMIYQGGMKKFCTPGLNCYSCPGAISACPLGSLQGSFSADKSTIYYVVGILLLYGVLFGRFICGWLCPFGFIQELCYKIKTVKLRKSPFTKTLSYIKYFVLIVFVLIVPIMYAFRHAPLPSFCKYICPAGTLEGGVILLSNKVNASYFSLLGPLFTWKFLLMISIVIGCIFVFRLFCRFLCPLGALYGLFNNISFFGVKINEQDCIHCNRCIHHCKMDIKHVSDAECIQCGECMDVCPTNAILWKGPKLVPDNKGAKTITRALSSILLVGLLIFVVVTSWNESNVQLDTGQNTISVGSLCPGNDLQIINSNGISQEIINPLSTDKITIVNFWGTWCNPCIEELPYFNQIASEYKDSVSVIAIHTNMLADSAPDYIANYYADSNIIFASDIQEEAYYSSLGGRGTYPYTIILDEEGIIQEIFLNPLEYDDLKTAVDKLLP